MDILQGNDHTLVSGYVDTGDARHGPSLLLAGDETPAKLGVVSLFRDDRKR
jgi:hypothetical protein